VTSVLLKHLGKRFGEVEAVKDVSLEIKDKELVVLLGPSGCGKTTTLRCIAGLEVPDEGQIFIGDTLVNDLPPKDRDVAMVFQSYALYPHKRVYDNIAFPLKARKASKQEIDRRVKEVAELLQIKHLLNRKPRQLSGGEAQRVALGRSIIREPKVFLMDEPLSNLDAKLRLYMRAELKKLQRQLGVTTIYVTHDQAEAMTMADRVTLMHRGRIQQVDMPFELFAHPNSVFVAGFIGSPPMNFISCTLAEVKGEAYLDSTSFRIPLERSMFEKVRANTSSSELIIGIRPDHVTVSGREGWRALATGEIYVVEPLGTETIVDVRIGENIIKVKEESGYVIDAGSKVQIAYNPQKIHIFDGKTEAAVL